MYMTGQMLGALDHRFTATRTGIVISVWGMGTYGEKSRHSTLYGDIADKHIFGRGVPQFDFMGFAQSDRDKLAQIHNDVINDILRDTFKGTI